MTRKASIKETGEELSQAEWARFDAAVAEEKAKRAVTEPHRLPEPDARRAAARDEAEKP